MHGDPVTVMIIASGGMAQIDEAASQARVLVAAHLGHINDLAHQLIACQADAAQQLRIVDRIIRRVSDATDVLEAMSAIETSVECEHSTSA
jgi:hypothetical protein